MNMQNLVKYAGIIAVIMALFLSGCGGKVQTLAYDKPIPENQSTILLIPETYTVTSFDGQQVRWKASSDFFAVFGNIAAIRLPSGNHNIAYSYARHEGGMTTTEHYASGAVVQKTTPSRTISFDGNITITMEAGKKYIFEGRRIVVDTNNYNQLP